MRVLHLHSGNLYGGIETMLATIARARSDADTHRFALCFDGRLLRALTAARADVGMLAPVRVSRPHTIWRARRRLAALLARDPIDVAITHSPWIHGLTGPTLRAHGVRAVQWVHGPLVGWPERWARRSPPSALICNSRYTCAALPAHYASLPAEVIHCPADLPQRATPDERADVRRELQTADDDVVVIQASRLEPWKGHMVHLRALARLAGLPGWTLWVVGGSQRPEEMRLLAELKTFAAAAGLSGRVRFAGEQVNVRRFLAASNIYCQPNVSPEPFGLAYVEAMAAGLPVVASDAGGVREIVDPQTGVLAPPNDVESLSAALHALIQDPSRRRRLGTAGVLRAWSLCDPHRQLASLHRFLTSMDAPAS